MLSSFRPVYTVAVQPDWSPQCADIISSELIIPYPSNHFFIPVEIGLSILPHPNLFLEEWASFLSNSTGGGGSC